MSTQLTPSLKLFASLQLLKSQRVMPRTPRKPKAKGTRLRDRGRLGCCGLVRWMFLLQSVRSWVCFEDICGVSSQCFSGVSKILREVRCLAIFLFLGSLAKFFFYLYFVALFLFCTGILGGFKQRAVAWSSGSVDQLFRPQETTLLLLIFCEFFGGLISA